MQSFTKHRRKLLQARSHERLYGPVARKRKAGAALCAALSSRTRRDHGNRTRPQRACKGAMCGDCES
uniref:Uncharacterized protein n=1 Tax=Arundo donax TaxID=35708 RepID=A0A0A8YAQ3_ARUDO